MTIQKKMRLMLALILLLFSINVLVFMTAIQYFEHFVKVKIHNSTKEANLTQVILHKNHQIVLMIHEALLSVQNSNFGHKTPTLQMVNKSLDEITNHLHSRWYEESP
jgi:hypothetical protein